MRFLSLASALVLAAALSACHCGDAVYRSPCNPTPTQVNNPSTDPYHLCPKHEVPTPEPTKQAKYDDPKTCGPECAWSETAPIFQNGAGGSLFLGLLVLSLLVWVWHRRSLSPFHVRYRTVAKRMAVSPTTWIGLGLLVWGAFGLVACSGGEFIIRSGEFKPSFLSKAGEVIKGAAAITGNPILDTIGSLVLATAGGGLLARKAVKANDAKEWTEEEVASMGERLASRGAAPTSTTPKV